MTVRVDGELKEISLGMKLDRYKNHSVELVIDRLKVSDKDQARLRETVSDALRQGDKQLMIYDVDNDELTHFSQHLMDPSTGLSYREPAPHNFSFNSPQGACTCCKGLGYVNIVDKEKIIPNDKLSVYDGGIVPLGKYKNSMIFWQINAILEKYGHTIHTPIKDISEEAVNDILNGTTERLNIENSTMSLSNYFITYEGLVKYIELQQSEDQSSASQKWSGRFFSRAICPECNGSRLNKEALHFFINGKNIAEISTLDLSELKQWVDNMLPTLSPSQAIIAREIIKEISGRIGFLIDVGLEYLSLNRASATLSGGESQRIRLATQIGSELVNVLYILDEPSIGLHSRDTDRLISVLRKLQQIGNTVIVVEHDEDIMRAADWIIDVGPDAGRHGGKIVYQGPIDKLEGELKSYTARYLTGALDIPVPASRRRWRDYIEIKGACEHNLKNVNIKFPLGVLTVVTGVSGSGKSTLVRDILYRALSRHFDNPCDAPGLHSSIGGDIGRLTGVEFVDQNPIGKSSRSNPATYVKAYDEIRRLFADQQGAKQMGFGPGYFSFNTEGGRCEACKGEGTITIEMQFMADITMECEECHGHRFKRDVLEITYRDKNISDILNMTVNEAMEFFGQSDGATEQRIVKRLRPLRDVGLGYVKLGQSSSTLSGGENQRVKLAYYLSMENSGPMAFIFDEPTTGLHFHDIRTLMDAFNRLMRLGHTVIIIEHNMDVIKCADHIIDIGPEGGEAGGNIVAEGTPEQVAQCSESYTAAYLRPKLGLSSFGNK